MLTDNQWFTERTFWHTEFFPEHKLWFRKNACSTWFFLEYPPNRSANERILEENRVAHNRGFTELRF